MFANRIDAGRQLSERLMDLKDSDIVVLGLPRGGVPVAREVAAALGAPLDVIMVRKLGLPLHPEVAMGAIGEDRFEVLDRNLIRKAGVTAGEVSAVESRERVVLAERLRRFRGARPPADLHGRTAVIVDDGMATGATAEVACAIARHRGASRVVLAVPVTPPDSAADVGRVADAVIAVSIPERFGAVGAHYRDFPQVSDDEVVHILDDYRQLLRAPSDGVGDPVHEAVDHAALTQIRQLAGPLQEDADLDGLVARLATTRVACVGEASHGTHEFYEWRARLTRRLIQEQHFTWIGVEGDWPDCWRINRWVRGREGQTETAAQMLAHFDRWPTWMWANRDVAEFLDWLRAWNIGRPADQQVGFYGLDVYSLWDSLRETIGWLQAHQPAAVPAAMQAWQCFLPYREDPHRYAWATRLVPASCEEDVVAMLQEVLRRTGPVLDDEDAFNAAQNAEVANNAERYYRTMVRGDRQSWNIRDHHMADTVDRLMRHLGRGSKGVIWEHNTHVGDARATDMGAAGMVNVGQLLRQKYGADRVGLIGFASHRGRVLAAAAWGEPEVTYVLPRARPDTHEDLLHHALGRDAVLVFGDDRGGPWLAPVRGHRAVGVVYDPTREASNYVPTVMGHRYDALLWIERSTALRPLHHEAPPREPELETEPSGF